MGLLAPKDYWPREAFTGRQILDKLTYWREHLLEHATDARPVLTRAEIVGQLDRWLDELSEREGWWTG